MAGAPETALIELAHRRSAACRATCWASMRSCSALFASTVAWSVYQSTGLDGGLPWRLWSRGGVTLPPSALIPPTKAAASTRMAATAFLIVRTSSAKVSSAVAAFPRSVPTSAAAVPTGSIAVNSVSCSGAS